MQRAQERWQAKRVTGANFEHRYTSAPSGVSTNSICFGPSVAAHVTFVFATIHRRPTCKPGNATFRRRDLRLTVGACKDCTTRRDNRAHEHRPYDTAAVRAAVSASSSTGFVR